MYNSEIQDGEAMLVPDLARRFNFASEAKIFDEKIRDLVKAFNLLGLAWSAPTEVVHQLG